MNKKPLVSEEHLKLVKILSAKIGRRLPDYVDKDDLYSIGCIGLTKALNTFESSKGVPPRADALEPLIGNRRDTGVSDLLCYSFLVKTLSVFRQSIPRPW